MIEGFINLSLPLKRLGFIKVIVWLTHPSSYMYTSQLVAKYKETIRHYREEFKWNEDPATGVSVAGSGIGKADVPANNDSIAMDHVLLAQSLGFIKREVNNWRKYGWHLASRYLGDKGKPVFLDPHTREEMMKTKGLIAKLPRSEQFIFSNALFSSDIDGTLPLVQCLDGISHHDLLEQYFAAVSEWYDRKSRMETNPIKRYFYASEKTKFAKSERQGGYKKVHRESQIHPRLHFLTDTGFIVKRGSKHVLSSFAADFKKRWASFDDKDIFRLLDEKESSLGILLAEEYGKGLNELSTEEFETVFLRLSSFYRYIGLVMIPYEDLYFSIVASALDSLSSLNFSTYREMVENLAKKRKFEVSANIPGRRYIRV